MKYPDDFDTPTFPAGKQISASRAVSIAVMVVFLLILFACGLLLWVQKSVHVHPFLVSINEITGQWEIVGHQHTDVKQMTTVQTLQESVIGKFLEYHFFVTDDADQTEVAKVLLKCTSGKENLPIDNLTDATGGTINLKSVANLDVDVSFTGDRISKESIDAIDQVSLNEENHFTTHVEFRQPEVHHVDISVDVCLSTSASVTGTAIMNDVRNAIIKLFDITPNYMGAGLKISDIYSAIMSVPNVRFCNVLEPTSNVITKPNAFMVLGDLNINEIVENY